MLFASIQSTNDYYPFGSPLPNRGFDIGSYKFGFNGKENDDEVYGDGNFQDYGMRMYDTRICRFVSVDPLTSEYPWYSPYQFAGNKPIWAMDLDGAEEWYRTDYFDANGNFYKTEIQMLTSLGSSKNEQTVHHCQARQNENGDFDVQYIRSTTGTTKGANAFTSPFENQTWDESALSSQLKQSALQVDDKGAPIIVPSSGTANVENSDVSVSYSGSYKVPFSSPFSLGETGYAIMLVDELGDDLGLELEKDRSPNAGVNENRVKVLDDNFVKYTFTMNNSTVYSAAPPTNDKSGLRKVPPFQSQRTPQVGSNHPDKYNE